MFVLGPWLSRSTRTSARLERRKPTAAARGYPLGLEVLEDRTAPALFLVNALTDTNSGGGGVGAGNAGDLRYVLTSSNTAGGTNSIVFQPGLSGTILLHAVLPNIGTNLSLNGPVDNAVVVNGNHLGSVFDVAPGETVSISGLTITGGNAPAANGGGGILNNKGGTLTVSNCIITDNSAAVLGGGILNDRGTLTVSNSILTGNSAGSAGGGIASTGTLTVSNTTVSGNTLPNRGQSQGGGILSNGTLTLSDSTIAGNFAQIGGGLTVLGTMIVSNSTISGNSALLGGGITIEGTVAILNSTITDNSVSGGGARGGGIFQPFPGNGPITLHDTILAANRVKNGASSPDFAGTVSASVVIDGATYNEGFNLIGNNTGSRGFTKGKNGDHVGTSLKPIDPKLGPLRNNGGPTETQALLPDSPALGAGDPNNRGALPQFDQRGFGFPRIVANRVDIGAFESQFRRTE
jgi:hypothetical protein